MKGLQIRQIYALMALIPLVLFIGCQKEKTVPVKIVCEKRCEFDSPKIVFVSTEYGFGKVKKGAKQKCSFDFVNEGGKDLVISRIRPSCGCTTTNTESMTIKPGHASEISVVYRATSSGKSKKRIVVHTNDPENPKVTLWVSADVIGTSKGSKKLASKPANAQVKKKQDQKGQIPEKLKKSLRALNKATD